MPGDVSDAERIRQLEGEVADLRQRLEDAPADGTHIHKRHYERQGERLAAQSDQIRDLLATVDALEKERERLKGIVHGTMEHIKSHMVLAGLL